MEVSAPRVVARRQPPLRRPRAGPEGQHQLGHLADGRRVQRAGGRRRHQLLEAPLQVGGTVPERGAALVGQQVHGDRPAAVDLAQQAVERHEHVVVEDLAELGAAVHRLDRPHRDAGRVHVDEQRRDATVGRLERAGAREQHAARGVLGQARPHLLAVDPPALVRAGRPAGERGQVAARARLREALAPDLVAAQEQRHHLRRQLLGGEVDHGGRQHLGHGVDAGLDQVPRGERLGQVGPEQVGATEPADALGPAHGHEAGVVGQAHDLAQLRHLLVEGPDALEGGRQLVGVLVEPVVDGDLERRRDPGRQR